MRLILLLFVSLGPALAQGGPIWVELKASASSGAGALTLGDIAEVDALDSKVAARLRRLVIGQVDTLPARLEVARVRKQLETSGYEASSLRFSGAKSVAFEKRELRIAAEEVEAAARRHLKRRMSAGVSTVELAGQIEDLHLPAPRYRVRSHVLADPSNPGLVGLVNLIYVVELDGRERARIRVPFRIQREMDVVVATRRIAAGTSPRARRSQVGASPSWTACGLGLPQHRRADRTQRRRPHCRGTGFGLRLASGSAGHQSRRRRSGAFQAGRHDAADLLSRPRIRGRPVTASCSRTLNPRSASTP